MRSLNPILIALLVLTSGALTGCSREPPRMKNQPTNLTSGETRIELPGKKKSFDAAK